MKRQLAVRRSTGLRGLIMSLLLGALLAVDVAVAGLGTHGLLIGLIILVLLVPMGLRYVGRRIDLFEPLVLANIALGMMFVGRPLADLATHETMHIGYPVTLTFDKALTVALTGIVAFQIGYHSRFPRRWARKLPAPPAFRPRRASLVAWAFFILGTFLFGMFLVTGGGLGLLKTLLRGRSGLDNGIYLNSTGYLYNGPLLWGASALIFFALAVASKRKVNYLWFTAVIIPFVALYGASGTRSNLLPLALAIPTFWYLWKRRRPSGLTLVIVALVGISLLGGLRETRTADTVARENAGSVLINTLSSPALQFGEILTGADDEMFDSITNELLVVPGQTGYRPGGTMADLLIRAVPRPLWPNKPLETNDLIVTTLWPVHYSQSRASAAFSVMGPFYLDSSYLGVALGMFLIGLVLALSWRWYLIHKANLNATLVYSMSLPFIVILMRGTIPDTLARMLFAVFPLVLLMWSAKLGRRAHVRARTKLQIIPGRALQSE